MPQTDARKLLRHRIYTQDPLKPLHKHTPHAQRTAIEHTHLALNVPSQNIYSTLPKASLQADTRAEPLAATPPNLQTQRFAAARISAKKRSNLAANIPVITEGNINTYITLLYHTRKAKRSQQRTAAT